jgi:hypothetical protein
LKKESEPDFIWFALLFPFNGDRLRGNNKKHMKGVPDDRGALVLFYELLKGKNAVPKFLVFKVSVQFCTKDFGIFGLHFPVMLAYSLLK